MLMSPLQMRVTLMDMGARGLQVRLILSSLSQVMDSVQVHHLALLLLNEHIIRKAGLVGGHSSMVSSRTIFGLLFPYVSTSFGLFYL